MSDVLWQQVIDLTNEVERLRADIDDMKRYAEEAAAIADLWEYLGR